MLEYKFIKFPSWLFSNMSNTTIGRKTHTPYSHWWKPLPWFCLLRLWSWTIQTTAGATVQWQREWQWINSRSVGRVTWRHGRSYDCSMLEYKVIKFPHWLFSAMSKTAIGRKTHAPDSHWWTLLPRFCLLRRRLWIIQGAEVVTVEWRLEWQWSNIRSVDRVIWSHKLS